MRLETYQVNEFPEVFADIMDAAVGKSDADKKEFTGRDAHYLHAIYRRFITGGAGVPVSGGRVVDVTAIGGEVGHYRYETPHLEGPVRGTNMRLHVFVRSVDVHHPLDYQMMDSLDRKDMVTMRIVHLVNNPKRHQELRSAFFHFYNRDFDRFDTVGDENCVNNRVKVGDVEKLRRIEQHLRREFARQGQTAYEEAMLEFHKAIARG